MARRDQQPAQPGAQTPFIHPQISRAAQLYQQGTNQRRQALPKTTEPVAGGAGPAIPPLEGGPQDPKMTMEQHAVAARGPQQPQAPMAGRGGIIAQPPMPQPGQQGPLNIIPTDSLPDQAKSDPTFIDGQGSMFAVSQPNLAAKYGVIRNGNHIPAQKLHSQSPQLRPETLEGLRQLGELQRKEQAPEEGVPGLHATEEEAIGKGSVAGKAAARIGNLPGDDDPEPIDQKTREKIAAGVNLDEFEFDALRQAMMKDVLNNPEQRRIIEARLKELDVSDMVVYNRVSQEIPVIPGKFWMDLQSMTGEEDIAIKRLIMQESKSLEVTDRYLLDKYSLMGATIQIKSICGKDLGTHEDEHGDFDDAKFWTKFKRVLKLPVHMLASIGVQIFWFDLRVRKLFVAEKVKNG